ncbi:hypothetical protein [Ilumatobacter nonamiensis]|uniref:hypothetical protein n=1 Tax=Ilumatobacter nonamiensis TaxID=467093 RepID=UPI00034C4E3B|nr:hypothetical protein [Ilumatobacter nonamiensis]
MTASSDRRRRFTILGAVLGGLGMVALIVISVVAVTTLRTSQEGRAPDQETRPVSSFPATPNALIGVVDDLDRLTSIAVLTLDPSGIGGSVVVVPVNVDRTNGVGTERLPVSRQPYLPGDEAQTAELMSEIEPLLTLTIERGQVVGPGELEELLVPFGPFEVDLSESIVDSDSPGTGRVVSSGSSTLDAEEMAEGLTAIDATETSYDHHETDVELWEAIAATGGPDVDVPLGPDDRPVTPASFRELWDRLFAGEVGVRALDIEEPSAQIADNDTDADFVFADRADALVVFGAVSPALVPTPNDSLTLSLVVGFDSDEVAELGETAGGAPVTKTWLARRFVSELLFGQANIVGVDLADTPEEVPAVTQLRIADESMESAARAMSEGFEDAEVVVADELIDGIDVVVVLGEDFLEWRAEVLEDERARAEAAAEENQRSDFDVSDSGDFTPSDTSVSDESADPDDASDSSDDSVPDTSSDTVADDG